MPGSTQPVANPIHPPHPRIQRAVRLIALFEAFKGVVVFFAGFGLLSLLNRDGEDWAESIVTYLQLNPAREYTHVFVETAARMNNSNLSMLATLAFFYALLRFVEAYGLWRLRHWGEWLGAFSGIIYLPIEIYEIIVKITWFRVSLFIINIVVVAFLLYSLALKHREKRAHHREHP